MPIHPESPSTAMTIGIDCPKSRSPSDDINISSNRKVGKHISTSTRRITPRSNHPRKYPAAMPTAAPMTSASAVARMPTASEVRAP